MCLPLARGRSSGGLVPKLTSSKVPTRLHLLSRSPLSEPASPGSGVRVDGSLLPSHCNTPPVVYLQLYYILNKDSFIWL